MYDALTLAAIVDELASEIEGARIQRILHADELTLGIEVYARKRRRWLILSADSRHARILLSDQRGDSDPERVSPILLLLRKHARSGRILAITQPRHERVLRFAIVKTQAPDDDDTGTDEVEVTHSELVVELMGRRSNLVFVDGDGTIHDAIKRVTPEMSRARPVLPGQPYELPPPQDKFDPCLADGKTLLDAARESDQSVQRWLVAAYQSVSPMLAGEIAHRAGVDPQVPASGISEEEAGRLAEATVGLFEPLDSGKWDPRLYTFDEGGAEFSAIPLRSLESSEGVTATPYESTLAAALAAWEHGGSAPAGDDRHATRRERLLREIDNARERVANRVHSLEEQAEASGNADELRTRGEMIYAYLTMIEPGQSELETPDGMVIPLDPERSPNENAQEYFEQYKKAKSAAERIPAMLRQAQRQREYLDQLYTLASQAETYDEIEAVRLEWIDYAENTQGVGRASRQSGASKPSRSARKPREYKTESGDTILIGRTGEQNARVTFDEAGPDDLWLHARELPGAHVILRPAPGHEPDEAIETAASLAAYYSDGRNSTSVPVDVTERRHVRKIKGAGPGMATYRNEYTLQVRPRSETDLGLTPVR